MIERTKYHFERIKNGVGKQILVFSSILVLNPSSAIFGIPLYVIGLLLIWNSKMIKKLKWRWSILPIIIAGILAIIIQIIYEQNPDLFPG